MPCSFPAHRNVAGTRTGLKAARPGLTALTPALLPARLETGRDPGEKGRISPLTGPAPSGMTCDDASQLCLPGGGGHCGGLSLGPPMVSVDRAEIPAAGWIRPELRPYTAADMIWEEIPAAPYRCRQKPSSRQDARYRHQRARLAR